MKFIREHTEAVSFLTEEVNGVKRLFLEGPFIQTEVANKNKRIYRMGFMENEVNRYVNENVKLNSAMGELGHPPTPNINLDRVSHHIKSLKREGNDFIGKAMVASTPYGKIVEGLHSDGARLGVSSRGLGSVKKTKDGLDEVQDDFRLSTPADIVASPSAPGAYVQGIMEDVEYWYDAARGTYVEEKLDDVKKHMRSLTIEQLEEQRLGMFQQFLNGLVTIRKNAGY